ncbi:MAG TPA: heavy-metal-associated domain-containing protein [Beijerinckiaceae bacterium]|nr:heavy-metal-associated domain-containing protein [Beijerinckiaceae bacterium]
MNVEGMSCDACAQAVTKAIRRLDPSAQVAVDLDHGRVTVETCAQAVEIAEVLAKAGYEAKGMTL